MTRPLVVGVDGSDASLAAIDWAVDEAVRHGLALRVVHACLWERYEGALPPTDRERRSGQVLAEHIVACAAERAERRNAEVKVTTEILSEDAATALLRAADSAFALVTGARGRGRIREMLLGSVGLAVAGRARCPVVVVRGDRAGLAGTHGRILLGLAGTGTGREALRFAFEEAGARGCTLDVVRAWRRRALDASTGRSPAARPVQPAEAAARALLDASLGDMTAGYPRVRTRRSAPEGPAATVLVHRSAAADLVIVGARRRTGRFGLQLGRVGHTLLHHAQCPVAVVPEPS